jgi:hypothetical protein
MTAPFVRLIAVTPLGRFPVPGLYVSQSAADSGAADILAMGASRVDVEAVGGPPSARPRACPSCSAPLPVDGRCELCEPQGAVR